MVHLVHELQVRRTARLLLTLADRDEAAERPGNAINSLARYVQLAPEDTDALARLGRAQLGLGHHVAAFATLEQVLRREPDREAERREIVTAAMSIGRFSDAQEHLQKYLLKAHPDDAELLDQLGQCQAALSEFSEAAVSYKAALERNPNSLQTSARLAALLLSNLAKPDEADAVMEQMVDNNASSSQAWLLRAIYRSQRRSAATAGHDMGIAFIKLAADDARRAVELAPNDLEALLVAADLVRRKLPPALDERAAEPVSADQQTRSGDDEARAYLEAGLKTHAKEPRLYSALANLEFQAGRREEALKIAKRGLEEAPGNKGLLWTLTELMILDEQFEEADKAIAQLRADSDREAPVDYLAAQLLIARGKSTEGCRLLEQLRPKLADMPELAKQADLLAGRCYDQLERVDDQLAAFRRAVAVDGQWAPARLGLAGSLLKIGRFDEAVEQSRLAAGMDGFPSQGLVTLARMMIVQRLRLAEPARDWRGVEQVLDAAAAQLPDSLDVPELRAEVFLAQGKPQAAQSCLAEIGEKRPDEIRIWLSRAALEERLGDWKAAEQLLADAANRLGDSAELRIGRARLLVLRQGEDAVEGLKALAIDAESFEKVQQSQLYTTLAFALRATGEREQAIVLAKRADAIDSDNLPALLLLFDLAIETADRAVMEGLLAEIRRIEGPEGGPMSHYGEALRLVIGAKREDSERLEAARRELTQARLQRPAWARVPLLEAQIEELRGNTAGAVDYYQKAIDLGIRQPATVQRLVALLFAQRRFAEADQALRKLDDEQTPFTAELGRLASKVSLQVEDFTRAIDMARKACTDSTNYADHLWLGQLAGALSRDARADAAKRQQLADEAGAALRRAVELAPKEASVWVALVQHLMHTEQADSADEVLKEVVQHVAPEELPLVLAECYLSMGRNQEALQQFDLALKARPDDVVTLRRAAEYYIGRGAFPKAEPLLQQLLSPDSKATDSDRAFARRGLALVFAAKNSYAKLREGVALLQVNLETDPASVADQKDMAIVLSRSPALADRKLAISMLTNLMREPTPDPSARLLLAQLYQRQRDIPNARREFQSLLATAGENPAYVAHYIRLLLAESEIAEAELWLSRLENSQPAALETKELQARVMVANGRVEAAVELLRQLLFKPAGEPNPTQVSSSNQSKGDQTEAKGTASPVQIALLMEELAGVAARRSVPNAAPASPGSPESDKRPPGELANETSKTLLQAAEQQLREAAAGNDVRARSALAGFLGRRGNTAEALTIWMSLLNGSEFESAALGCSLLAAGQQLDARQLANVEQCLIECSEKHAKALGPIAALAIVHDAQAKYDESESAYRRILALDDHHAMALNNLALNLALRNKSGREALSLIDRAIEANGPAATMLDTRASVYLALGQADKAIVDLDEAIASSPSAAYYFHLARAHWMAGDRDAAAAAVKRAQDAGLREGSLHALERAEYRKVLDSVSARLSSP